MQRTTVQSEKRKREEEQENDFDFVDMIDPNKKQEDWKKNFEHAMSENVSEGSIPTLKVRGHGTRKQKASSPTMHQTNQKKQKQEEDSR